ncbi:divalent metal cation transporter [Candidatus Roizmanbacteria bacterium]|nr:divalent metal cation transporter [Candidatus Roizmanbacteria bacterium]
MIKDFINRYKLQFLLIVSVVGPGLISAFADNDAGGVATYSVAASKFGYSIFTTLIPITLVLVIAQELGARLAIVTGKGLGDLIRERYGILVSLVVFGLLFFVNFGVILQDLSGLKSAFHLFGLPEVIFLPLAIIFLFFIITKSSYSRIERFFLFLIIFYLTYLFSAFLAKPDWSLAFRSLFTPGRPLSFDYLFTSVAVLGTTVTLWGQFFINSYIKDKKIMIENLKYEQIEIYLGSFLTNIFSLFIMVAVAATIFQNKIRIEGAAEAALALRPFAGQLASLFFGLGLLIAGLLGCAIVPLATAYAYSEIFGFEGSLDTDFKRSKLFYNFFLIQIIIGLFIVLLPEISLFKITLYADFLNGLMLPVIFYFLYQFANDEQLMGNYKNSKWQNVSLIAAAVIISLAALAGGIGNLLHL